MKRDKHLTHGFGQRSHKYIARVPNGRGYRYFYDADEYRAYQQGKSGGEKKKSVWSTLGTVGSVTGNQGLITFANTMDLLQNHYGSKPPSDKPHFNRPHSRKVKIGKGTVTVRKGKRVGESQKRKKAKQAINAVRKAIYQLHKKRRKPSNSRPSGGGGRIDY